MVIPYGEPCLSMLANSYGHIKKLVKKQLAVRHMESATGVADVHIHTMSYSVYNRNGLLPCIMTQGITPECLSTTQVTNTIQYHYIVVEYGDDHP